MESVPVDVVPSIPVELTNTGSEEPTDAPEIPAIRVSVVVLNPILIELDWSADPAVYESDPIKMFLFEVAVRSQPAPVQLPLGTGEAVVGAAILLPIMMFRAPVSADAEFFGPLFAPTKMLFVD